LDDLVRPDEVRYIGCSNLMAWQIMKAFGTSAREGLARFETVQASYSITTRDLEREIIPRYGHHAFRIRVMALSS
jgi:aryl-alcohol dehydrogenase-like predicted oxidoreductase